MANRNRKKTASVEVVESVEKELYENVRSILAKARATVYVAANAEMVKAYWNVGREIVEKQGGADRAKYGDGLIKNLSVKLTAEFGPGYTGTSLRYMRLVYLTFPNCHTLCDKLTWSHYRLLAAVDKKAARDFYLSEAMECNASAPPLKRQWRFALCRRQRLIRRLHPARLSKGANDDISIPPAAIASSFESWLSGIISPRKRKVNER